ncbi:MAG: sulfite exporter TauE/SafE family protein [Bacteroidota bacterium]
MEINPFHIAALGMAAGVLAGLLGIGGAIVIIPVLVFAFGMTQQQAQGTTMAFLTLPVGILGAYVYYERGLVDVRWALLLAVGFVVGSFVGARIATTLSNEMLQKIFGVLLIGLGIRMVFFSR